VSNILSCPSCAAVIVPQEAGEFCPKCRTPLPQSAIETVMPQDLPGMDDATRLAPGTGSVPSKSSSGPHDRGSRDRGSRDARDSRASSSTGWLSSSGAIDHGRFEPGTLLGGRYRVVERLGRGGMGEVYRADDLKLGQPVALKFLPPDVDRDPARLTQLHTEVRMARQVSHPNVCRVYDIDEVDGATFLSMEYVDGEDLSSLLRRVGRFPEERGLEIARQICAGLAAAHERNVIHRDLKPANVMLDGTGKVRITDFGLAGASGEAIRAGTPAYMAPEQLSGNEVTARSDIYALGLVLYEIFTGQRALEGKNLAELIHKREQSGILPPTAIVKTLDLKIERAILRCLKPAVDERPASALAVAASLPGGDPLAAALAAGETPSPEMVAAAGVRAALSVRATVAAVAWILVSLVLIVFMYQRVIMLNRLPMAKAPAALQDRAQETLAALGYGDTPVDDAAGLTLSANYPRFIAETSTAPDRWTQLSTVRPGVFFLWYRTSPRALIPWGNENPVGGVNPPMMTAGMALIVVDSMGRLAEFSAVPSPIEPQSVAASFDWKRLFDASGLPLDAFTPVPPGFVPTVFADERRAWEGKLPERPDLTVRVEAAARAGKPVFFGITGPWTRSSRSIAAPPSLFTRIMSGLATVIMPGLMLLGVVLARSNLKAGRGDRQGAIRTASFIFAVSLAAWALGATHVAALDAEIGRVFSAVGRSLFDAGLLWVTYLGLEPYVRRYSPDSILGWTRLLAGHWRDPRVGVDLIVGVSAGLGMTVLFALHNLLPPMAGYPEPMPIISHPQTLIGLRHVFASIATTVTSAIGSGMLGVMGVVGFVLLFRRVPYRLGLPLAVLAATICFTPVALSGMFNPGTPRLDLAIGAAIILIFVATIVRGGLLAAISALFTHFILLRAPVTTDLSSWRAPFGLWCVGTVLVLGFGACYIAGHRHHGQHGTLS
jgi:tRNA A-37 threonylcarbamoyl transferase component Bud32